MSDYSGESSPCMVQSWDEYDNICHLDDIVSDISSTPEHIFYEDSCPSPPIQEPRGSIPGPRSSGPRCKRSSDPGRLSRLTLKPSKPCHPPCYNSRNCRRCKGRSQRFNTLQLEKYTW